MCDISVERISVCNIIEDLASIRYLAVTSRICYHNSYGIITLVFGTSAEHLHNDIILTSMWTPSCYGNRFMM